MTEEPIEILGSHMPAIARLLREREHLPGVIAEMGCYAGATTFELAKFGRYVYAMDSFSGIPRADFTDGLDIDPPGKFKPPSDLLERFHASGNIIPVVGRFKDTLTDSLKLPVIGCYLDADLYESTKQALNWLAKNLLPGGFIVVDDYATHEGVRRAIDEFLAAHPNASFDGSGSDFVAMNQAPPASVR